MTTRWETVGEWFWRELGGFLQPSAVVAAPAPTTAPLPTPPVHSEPTGAAAGSGPSAGQVAETLAIGLGVKAVTAGVTAGAGAIASALGGGGAAAAEATGAAAAGGAEGGAAAVGAGTVAGTAVGLAAGAAGLAGMGYAFYDMANTLLYGDQSPSWQPTATGTGTTFAVTTATGQQQTYNTGGSAPVGVRSASTPSARLQ